MTIEIKITKVRSGVLLKVTSPGKLMRHTMAAALAAAFEDWVARVNVDLEAQGVALLRWQAMRLAPINVAAAEMRVEVEPWGFATVTADGVDMVGGIDPTGPKARRLLAYQTACGLYAVTPARRVA